MLGAGPTRPADQLALPTQDGSVPVRHAKAAAMTLSPSLPLSTRLRDVRGSAIRDLLALTARPEVISLAGGLPGTDLLPRERVATALAASVTDPAAVQYGETAGLRRLREVVAAQESQRLGRAVDASGVVVTSGSQQALDLLARAVLDPGDPVVVEDPAYVGALQVFQAAGAALHPVPVDGEGEDGGMAVDVLAARLAAGLRPKLVHTVASFHNPRGVTLSAPRRAALAELADRYGFLVVEDDPYGLLAFDGTPPAPVAAHGERVVRLGSASKVLAPALRVGWLTGPAELLGGVERLKQCTDLCTSSLTQAVAAELLADSTWFAAHVDRLRAALHERATVLTGAVRAVLGDAVTCSTPTGGMFCWLEATDGSRPADLLPGALEHGVGYVPGTAFAVGRDLSAAARLCFASNPPDQLRTAVERLGAAWRGSAP